MFRFWSSIVKEARVFWSDKVGLLFMFLMPLLLVTVVTIVQNSAFQLVNKNRISMLLVNHDTGEQGQNLVNLLEESGMFGITCKNALDEADISEHLKKDGALSAVFIPEDFSSLLEAKARQTSEKMLDDFGLFNGVTTEAMTDPRIALYYDPVLQESFTMTISNVLDAYLASVESSLMIDLLYQDLEVENKPENIAEIIAGNRVGIDVIAAHGEGNAPVALNATQHNVPAWTIFAMFFMVISLGGNMVKEMVNGSFVRIKTMPSSILWVMSAKMFLYLLLAITQVAIIFAFGATVFQYLKLPLLDIPENWPAFATVVLVSGLAAVSYAMLIGAFTKTQNQANSFGAISVIIFAALGGIWVPVFLMPDYLQKISSFSPLRQSLDAFYVLFLKGGNWPDLWPSLAKLLIFIMLCQGATIFKFRMNKLL